MGSRGMLVPFYIHVVLETVHILMILNFVWNLTLDFFFTLSDSKNLSFGGLL